MEPSIEVREAQTDPERIRAWAWVEWKAIQVEHFVTGIAHGEAADPSRGFALLGT